MSRYNHTMTNEPATTFLRRRKTEMTFVTRRPAGPTVASSKVWGVKPNIDLYTTITFSLQETLIITNRNLYPALGRTERDCLTI